MFSLGENMIEFLPTLGVLLLIPAAILGVMWSLDKGEGVRTQTNVEKKELQKIVDDCLLRSTLS